MRASFEQAQAALSSELELVSTRALEVRRVPSPVAQSPGSRPLHPLNPLHRSPRAP